MSWEERFNGYEPTTILYWKTELAYWQEVKRQAFMSADHASTTRADKAITICTKHLRGMIKHG